MKEFLNELYSYEYFGVYLIISIVVLIILFIIILCLGKKDKREREKTATLKLQQIQNEAFKEDSVMESLEVPEIPVPSFENDTIIVPNISDVSDTLDDVVDEIPDPVLPTQNEIEEVEQEENTLDEITDEIEEPNIDLADTLVMEQVELNEQTPVYEEVVTPVEEVTPLLSKVEEKPLVFSDYKDEDNIPSLIDKVEVQEPEEVEVPTFNFDEIIKGVEETKKENTYQRGPQIFSSVYVPQKEVEEPKVEIPDPVIPSDSSMDDLGIELPTLKKEVVEDVPVVESPIVEEAPVAEAETKDEQIEMPVLNDYNLDSLSGEIYNINK